MNKLIYSVFVFFLASTLAIAQPNNTGLGDYVPAAPNMASLGQYSDVPVNLASGIPRIGVPFGSVTDGGLSINIGLSYHASGIRVDQMASSAGLGWTLNAGGAITRTVKGLADDRTDGYYTAGHLVNNSTYRANQVRNGDLDGQSDVYSFNAAGHTGKFYFDANHDVVMVPLADYKIEEEYSSSISDSEHPYFKQAITRFTITAPNGDKLHFGKQPGQSYSQGKYDKTRVNSSIHTGGYDVYISSWHLVKIESHDGKSDITFSYERENQYYKNLATCCESTCQGEYVFDSKHRYNATRAYTQRITGIYGHNTEAEIIYDTSSPRQDIGVYYLDNNAGKEPRRIKTVKVKNGTYCKQFELAHDYYVDNSHSSIEEGKRLRLLSVTEKSCNGSITLPPYLFQYNGNNLPYRFHKGKDHWGYYNGANANENYTTNAPTYVGGQSYREPNESHSDIGVLEKITYPTGGYTQFTYENNRYSGSTGSSGGSQNLFLETCSSSGTNSSSCCGWGLSDLEENVHLGTMSSIQNTTFTMSFTKNVSCNSGLREVGISVSTFPGNQYVGFYSFNVDNSDPNTVYMTQPLSVIGSFTPNTIYKFTLTSTDGRGTFSMNYTEGTEVNNVLAGGLRIKQIKTHDGIAAANDVIRHFTYEDGGTSSGVLYSRPTYQLTGSGGLTGISTSGVRDESYWPLSSAAGEPMGYSKVTEYISGNGSTEHYFHAKQDVAFMNSQLLNGNPSCDRSYYAQNGMEYKTIVKNQSGTVVASTITEHEPEATYKTNPVFYISVYNVGGCNGTGQATFPDYLNSSIYRVNKVTKKLDNVTTITDTEYDIPQAHYFPTKTTVTNSDGNKHITEMFYSPNILTFEPSYGSIANELKNRNIVGVPLITKKYFKKGSTTTLVDGSWLQYGYFNSSTGLPTTSSSGSHPYPKEYKSYDMTFTSGGSPQPGSWYKDREITEYSSDGLPEKVTQTGWSQQTYNWNSKRLASTMFNSFTTSYAYHNSSNLVSTITDIDGQVTSFSYDALMRLTQQSARGGKVTKSYLYHYGAPATGGNYVRLTESYDDPSNYSYMSDMGDKITNTYMDGVGRLLQSVEKAHSPSNKDIVTKSLYDNKGRVIKSYNPYHNTSSSSGGYDATSVPSGYEHTLTVYYSSPLNRIYSITPPGWYATTYSYSKNGSNDVRNYAVSNSAYYASGTLNSVSVKDPEGVETIRYTDRLGLTILKRVKKGSQKSDTYYVYDGKNRLIKIIPPGSNLSQSNLNYLYTYDGRDNMISKKVPDQAIVNYKYNTRNLQTHMRDGNLASATKWFTTDYDAYGRVKKTGFFSGSFPNPNSIVIHDKLTETGYDGKYADGSTYTTNARYRGKPFETLTKVMGTSTFLKHRNYYDTYGRVKHTYGTNHKYNNTEAEYNKFYYDFADNIIHHIHRQNVANGSGEKYVYREHHVNKAGLEYRTYDKYGSTNVKLSEKLFDHKYQVMTNKLGYTGSSNLQKVDYSYNAQGWLTGINRFEGTGTMSLPSCTTLPNPSNSSNVEDNDLFALLIQYNSLLFGVAGQVQKNGNISQLRWQVRGRMAQVYGFYYDYLSRIKEAKYYDYTNLFFPTNTNKYYMTASYDARGNITDLDRKGANQSGNCFNYNYIDKLDYNYQSGTNKISSISDSAPSSHRAEGYNRKTTGNYQYDANGNITFDPAKNVTITYNHLNLPTKFQFTGGNRIENLYDANGTKLQKKVYLNNVLTETKDYVNGREYVDNKLEAIYNSVGRNYNTSSSGESMRYEYNITDHLGNVRLTFTDKDGDGKIEQSSNETTNEVLQETHYYPFGMAMKGPWINDSEAKDNKYTYNGKELIDDLDLGLHDYGARYYDPAIARWTAIDPLAEIIPEHSTYAYVFNNPISFNDPTGMMGEGITSTHVDTEGNLIDHFDDGDDNVYVHDLGTTPFDLEKAKKKGTSRGGDNALGTGKRAIELQKYSAGIHIADKYVSGEIDRFQYLMAYNALEEDYMGMGKELLYKHKWDVASYVPWFVWMKFVRAGKGGISVLGHYPEYVKLANKLNAKRFNIPTEIWKKMTDAERWIANQKFLDRMIARGDKIRLATPLNKVRPGTYYERELNYLFGKGYRVKGNYLIK